MKILKRNHNVVFKTFILLSFLLVTLNVFGVKTYADNLEDLELNYLNDFNGDYIEIKTKNLKGIILPNGNVVYSNNFKYLVDGGKDYEFKGIRENGEIIRKSIFVKTERTNTPIIGTNNFFLTVSGQDQTHLSGLSHFDLVVKKGEEEVFKTTKSFNGANSVKVPITLSTGGRFSSTAIIYDKAGNFQTVSQSFILDIEPPTIKSFAINNGAEYTKDKNVVLNFNIEDEFSVIDKLLVSNDNKTFKEFKYTDNMKTLNWILSDNTGMKTVYLKAVDALGNVSTPITDTIYFDDITPKGTIKINNGNSIVNSREVELTLEFADNESGIKFVRVIEGDRIYEFPSVPNSPTTIPWILDIGETGQVIMELVDNAGNVYRTNSNIVNISTLEITSFKLTNVVNPSVFNPENPFKPLTWSFAPQKMVSGGNVDFEIYYRLDTTGSLNSVISGEYTIEIIHANGYSYKQKFDYNKNLANGMKGTFKIPNDAPKGSEIFISSTISASVTGANGTFVSKAYFPLENSKAKIGYVEKNIKETIKFNEYR